jgi:polysaccharide export outer membrane protein
MGKTYSGIQKLFQWRKVIPFLLVPLLSHSCVTADRVTYLQEYEGYSDSIRTDVPVPDFYRVRVNDNLYVRVVTPDARYAMMFNAVPSQGGGISSEQVDLISYRVLQDGSIQLPFIGSVHVEGNTLPEITAKLDEAFRDYITDADITVKLVNNFISLVGEVNRPGRYPLYKEQLNVFEAISLAGDLTNYSDRQHVQIIRDTPEGRIVKEIDMQDKELIFSEYYYVLPNDVIYAKPIKGLFFRMESFPFALVFSTITTFLLILNYFS